MEKSRTLVTELNNSVALIRFNHLARRNSLSLATLEELRSTLKELLFQQEVRVLIFTGTDDVFTTGADLRELAELSPASALEFAKLGQTVFQMLGDAKQVTIAAINGYCMGGGLDLALACDIRVASAAAVFSHPGARRGIITGWGGTQRLASIIRRPHALELFLTAEGYSSTAALHMGLVSAVGDPVLELAQEYAHKGARIF